MWLWRWKMMICRPAWAQTRGKKQQQSTAGPLPPWVPRSPWVGFDHTDPKGGSHTSWGGTSLYHGGTGVLHLPPQPYRSEAGPATASQWIQRITELSFHKFWEFKWQNPIFLALSCHKVTSFREHCSVIADKSSDCQRESEEAAAKSFMWS